MSAMNSGLRTAAAALCLGLAASAAQAADIKASCDAIHITDASMVARYSHTPVRATFDVSFKAPGYVATLLRSPLPVTVNGTLVGTLALTRDASGDLSGSLSLDSYANDGLAQATVTAFPTSWPAALPTASRLGNSATRPSKGALADARRLASAARQTPTSGVPTDTRPLAITPLTLDLALPPATPSGEAVVGMKVRVGPLGCALDG